MLGGDDGADADVAGEVDIWHEGDVADIVGLAASRDGFRHIDGERLGEPSGERCEGGGHCVISSREGAGGPVGPMISKTSVGAFRRVIAAATSERSRPR